MTGNHRGRRGDQCNEQVSIEVVVRVGIEGLDAGLDQYLERKALKINETSIASKKSVSEKHKTHT